MKFNCGKTCDCKDNECKGNPEIGDFDKFKLIDLNYIRETKKNLETINWRREEIKTVIGTLDHIKGLSLNIALTGKVSNPVPMFDCLEILGRDLSLDRLSNPKRLMFT